eukprot:6189887-Pleurochrysis_carterae.AAC.3
MDVLKQRLQVAPADLGVLGAVRAACEQTGLVGLWRGYTAGICVWGPFSSVYFATYEALRDAYGRERAGSNLYAGMGGGAAAALITQPLDCAKTRLQVGATAPGAWLFESMRDIFAKEGFRALMRGGIARALYLAPGCGISVTVFDLVSAALKPDHPNSMLPLRFIPSEKRPMILACIDFDRHHRTQQLAQLESTKTMQMDNVESRQVPANLILDIVSVRPNYAKLAAINIRGYFSARERGPQLSHVHGAARRTTARWTAARISRTAVC